MVCVSYGGGVSHRRCESDGGGRVRWGWVREHAHEYSVTRGTFFLEVATMLFIVHGQDVSVMCPDAPRGRQPPGGMLPLLSDT